MSVANDYTGILLGTPLQEQSELRNIQLHSVSDVWIVKQECDRSCANTGHDHQSEVDELTCVKFSSKPQETKTATSSIKILSKLCNIGFKKEFEKSKFWWVLISTINVITWTRFSFYTKPNVNHVGMAFQGNAFNVQSRQFPWKIIKTLPKACFLVYIYIWLLDINVINRTI